MRRLLVVLGIFILLVGGVILLWPNNQAKQTQNQQNTTTVALPDYAKTDAVLSMTINGPIVAQEKHWAIEIDVAQNYRNIKIYQGYQQHVVKQQAYDNNQTAFSDFLYALQTANFTSQKESAPNTSEQGSCPVGERIIYEINQGTDQKLHTWTTSCGANIGTFGGNSSLARNLFQSQIPEYAKLYSTIDFSY